MKPEPVFLDTNIFLRYLTDDVPEQATAVERMLHRAAAGELALVTSPMVMAEIVWTLESFYQLPREDIRERVLAILNTHGLEVIDGALILQAIHWFVDRNVDFIDAYNAAWLVERGIQAICTFDRKHFSRVEARWVFAPGDEPF